MYNFDKVIDRSGSDDLKHGALLPRWGRDDLLPLWVADMDFETHLHYRCPQGTSGTLSFRLHDGAGRLPS